jgi:tRNA(Arg) A34 adenosine deaminase TadA
MIAASGALRGSTEFRNETSGYSDQHGEGASTARTLEEAGVRDKLWGILRSPLMNNLIRRLLTLALQNVSSGKGGPFAAAVVRGGTTLAFGTEQTKHLLDPTAHAEILAIRAACQAIASSTLEHSELFSLFEPCSMCLATLDEVLIKKANFVLPLEFAANRGWIDISLARPPCISSTVQRSAIDDGEIKKAVVRQLATIPLGNYCQEVERRII